MTQETLITGANNTDTGQQQGSEATTEATATEGAEQTSQQAAPEDTQGENQAPEGAKTTEGEPQGAPEKYEFKFPEGVKINEKFIDEFSTVAKELGLSQDNAQKLADFGPKLTELFVSRQQEVLTNARKEWREGVTNDKELGGDALAQNLSVAKRALDTFGSPELSNLLKESGLGDHPEVVRFFYRVGKQTSEDTVHRGDPSAGGGDKTIAQRLYSK